MDQLVAHRRPARLLGHGDVEFVFLVQAEFIRHHHTGAIGERDEADGKIGLLRFVGTGGPRRRSQPRRRRADQRGATDGRTYTLQKPAPGYARLVFIALVAHRNLPLLRKNKRRLCMHGVLPMPIDAFVCGRTAVAAPRMYCWDSPGWTNRGKSHTNCRDGVALSPSMRITAI